MRDLFKWIGNRTNKTEFDYNIYPDYPAPIARKDGHGELELSMLRWGMPMLLDYLKPNKKTGVIVDSGVTDVRKTGISYFCEGGTNTVVIRILASPMVVPLSDPSIPKRM